MFNKAKIDLPNKRIIGRSGTIYRIEPEKISAGRWQNYMIQSVTLGMNTTFQEVYNSYRKIYEACISGNNILGNLETIRTEAQSKLGLIDQYKANDPNKLIEFAALFCNSENEDVGLYDTHLVAKKAEDWADIPQADFFLLSTMAIPEFRRIYKEQTGEEVEQMLMNLTQNQ